MTAKEAYEILGLPPGSEPHEVKKRYRQLMAQIHPDANISSKEYSTYHAQEINHAYSVLKKEPAAGRKHVSHSREKTSPGEKKHAAWDAPVNINAYAERDILHYAEGQDGTVLGSFCIARGKYLWTVEEDFPLFLLSMYRCGKQLLDEIDAATQRKDSPAIRQQIQTELTYLLAQQFIDGDALLKKIAKEEAPDKDGRRIYHISSMLEPDSKEISLEAGQILYPSRVRQHKLYLKNQTGQELGYLSFLDDRLYYVVIPLFEQKAVQVRIQAAERPSGTALHLWIKPCDEAITRMPENLNLQIGQLLGQYKRKTPVFR